MTKDASFKKVVRGHAEETGQRDTESLRDLEGLGGRLHHEPDAERLLAHLGDRYRIEPVAATKLSVHKTYVFRVDRRDGGPWVARAFPPARPQAGVEGDAAILRPAARVAPTPANARPRRPLATRNSRPEPAGIGSGASHDGHRHQDARVTTCHQGERALGTWCTPWCAPWCAPSDSNRQPAD